MLAVVILQVYWLDPLAQVVVLLMSILYAFVFYKQTAEISILGVLKHLASREPANVQVLVMFCIGTV